MVFFNNRRILAEICRVAAYLNKHMHSDSKKRRSFLALLFAAGDVRRWQYHSCKVFILVLAKILRRKERPYGILGFFV